MSTIIYCATHDIPLRGKDSSGGNFCDLLDFRIEAGDTKLKEHFDTAAGNARYTSHRVQNELLEACEYVIRKSMVQAANNAVGFSILADETADIAGIEQLSLGIRFVDNDCIREEFLGFVPLGLRDAQSVSNVIVSECIKYGLHLEKLLGQGYDGCSTMAGIQNGVQAKIRELYPKAAFVHCASHRLNLVVNDVNDVPEIRNAVGVIKKIIKFFRESPKRRALVPIYLFCVRHDGLRSINPFVSLVRTLRRYLTAWLIFK